MNIMRRVRCYHVSRDLAAFVAKYVRLVTATKYTYIVHDYRYRRRYTVSHSVSVSRVIIGELTCLLRLQ